MPDPRFSDGELSDALETVKRRVHRRRGGTVLPVLVAITVGAGAYLTVLQPVTGDHVVVGVPGTEVATSEVDTTAAPEAIDEADADPSSASNFEPDATADFAAQADGATFAPDSTAGVNNDSAAEPAVTTTATPPGSGDSFAPDRNRPNPPAISFDTSNVITRESDASASTSTPPMSDADNGSAASDMFSVGRPDGSDDAVGESSHAGGLEGPHTASPESSTTGNPSAGSDDSGDGANWSVPPISFEDTGAAPELSATTSTQAEATAAMPRVVTWHQAIEGRTLSLSLTIIAADGSTFPCGVFVDFGGGEVQSIPCTADCQVPATVANAASVGFEHTYADAGQAFIVVGVTDAACLADPGLQFSVPLS